MVSLVHPYALIKSHFRLIFQEIMAETQNSAALLKSHSRCYALSCPLCSNPCHFVPLLKLKYKIVPHAMAMLLLSGPVSGVVSCDHMRVRTCGHSSPVAPGLAPPRSQTVIPDLATRNHPQSQLNSQQGES